MWTSRKINGRVIEVRVGVEGEGWEQWVLLASDRHIDSTHSDWKLQKRHLDEALERNAIVLDNGDLFDAMQGKGDRRHHKNELLEELKVDNYYDALVEYAYDKLLPYKDLFALIGDGNHERGALKHHEINLNLALCRRLGITRAYQGYSGWVTFRFTTGGIEGPSKHTFIKRLYRTHGAGGGGPVTKGFIKNNRRRQYLDADIITAGHIHEAWQGEQQVVFLDRGGNERLRTVEFIQTPTYKREFATDGYHDENERSPKPQGAHWLRFYRRKDENGIIQLVWDTIRAR